MEVYNEHNNAYSGWVHPQPHAHARTFTHTHTNTHTHTQTHTQTHTHTHAHTHTHTHTEEYLRKVYTYYTYTYTLKVTTEIINQKRKLEEENMKLKKRAATMREKMGSLASQLQKAKQRGFHQRRGVSRTKPPSHYTKRHLRRLRQQHRENAATLWLG